MSLIQPTYYVRHPDDTYSVADPQPVASEPSSGEREKLIEKINKQLGDKFDPADCFYEEELLHKAAALLSSDAKPASEQEGYPVEEIQDEIARLSLIIATNSFYQDGHKDGLEWAAQMVEYNDPRTGDWMWDDRNDLANVIRKGPEMPASEPVAVPQGYPCEIEEADFEANTITVKMLTNDYRIHAGEYRLSAAPSPAPVGIKKENQ